MRRMILTSLLLSPAMAFAQAGHVTAAASPYSVLLAELNQPAAIAAVAPNAAAKITLNAASIAVHESIQSSVIGGEFMEAALRQGGGLEYSLRGAAPLTSTAPVITKAVEVSLSAKDLELQPAESKVVVKATIDQYGIPRDIVVTKSAGSAAIDQKAVAAVQQYRFKPATIDSRATSSTVAIAIKLQK